VRLSGFAIGRYAVTFDEFDFFCAQTEHPLPADEGWGRENNPVIHVSWYEAQAYVAWLTQLTGRIYRLPTRAEREYAARAGTTTRYWWGDQIDAGDANHIDTPGWGTFSVGSLASNPWGLYNILGNVDEWVEESSDRSARVVCGGNWSSPAVDLQPGTFRFMPPDARNCKTGFRVAREI
jgi:formylglycine-generating enzyme required for sulfatase activity